LRALILHIVRRDQKRIGLLYRFSQLYV
jgi:hypothetical protein